MLAQKPAHTCGNCGPANAGASARICEPNGSTSSDWSTFTTPLTGCSVA